jgi:1-deoxy-D-xylulose-5-phosphate synthase
MSAVIEKFPERFCDVAIAEQHAVTSMGPLAKEGFKPFCTIYSTFLQRGYDQVIHDIALMDLGVVFALDRAGIVGEDGETHQGVFDISFLRAIPNMTLFAPYNETTMKLAMAFAKAYDHPCAFRYPRGAFMADDCPAPVFELGRSELLQEGESDILFIGYGNGVGRAQKTAEVLALRQAQGTVDNSSVPEPVEGVEAVKPAILDLRFVKPLDEEMLTALAKRYKKWFVFSDSAKQGGVGSAILEFLSEKGMQDITLTSFEYDDAFITHGNTKLVEESLGLLPEQIAQAISEKLKIKN